MALAVGSEVIIKIDKIVFGGEGLGYYNDFAIFVPMSVPGDEVKIEIISKKKSYGRGIIKEVLVKGPERVNDDRVTFEDFHGCDFGMLEYESQLKYKEEAVKDVMIKLGGLDNPSIRPIIGSDHINNYRNKVIEPFSYDENKKIITGMFKRKSHEVFEVKENILSSTLANKIINIAKSKLNDRNISVYNEIEHRGILRHIMVRTNSYNEAMLVLIINSKKVSKDVSDFLLEMFNEVDEVVSVYISLNTEKTNFALGKKLEFLYGKETIKEDINNIHFNISPSSFFQINLDQTKKLYDTAISYFSDIDNKFIVDAFSGTGTIGMILSNKARKIYAIEIVESATEDGKKTSRENNISNIDFIRGDVNKEIKNLLDRGNKVDSIIFDPPRKGVEEITLRGLAKHQINELVYISCNPSTLARDIKILREEGYEVNIIQPLDMFPHTSHIECIAHLTLTK